MLFDSHCHFTDEAFDEDRDALAGSIRAAGMKIVDIGTDLKTSEKCVAAAEKYDFCYAAVGYHPSEVEGLTDEILDECLSLYRLPKVVAIGEIGLDYHYDDGPDRGLQQLWFRKQLQQAVRLGAPVCIHTRDADADTLQILKEEIFNRKLQKDRLSQTGTLADTEQNRFLADTKPRVLMHCFSGSAELARQYVKLGAKISIAGPVTYKNARRNIEVVEAVDLKDLLIETDSPYLAPVPMRGKKNTPPYVEYVARKIAEIKGISFEEVAGATFRNAREFYGLGPAE